MGASGETSRKGPPWYPTTGSRAAWASLYMAEKWISSLGRNWNPDSPNCPAYSLVKVISHATVEVPNVVLLEIQVLWHTTLSLSRYFLTVSEDHTVICPITFHSTTECIYYRALIRLLYHNIIILYYSTWWTAVAQWLRCCATNRKVAGSIPDGVTGIFHWHNPSDRTKALGSTQSLTKMSTRRISWG